MEREDRIGAWVSGVAHGALILWALLAGALFRANDPLPVESVQVGTMTDADFQAMAAATRGPGPVADGATRPPQALAQDQTADPAPEAPRTTQTPPPFGTLPPALTDPGATPEAPSIPATPLSPLALEHSPLPRARPEGLVEAAQARAEAARLAALTAQREAEAAEAARIAAAEAAERQAEADRQAEAQRAAQAEAARQAEVEHQAEAARQAEAEAQAERAAETRRQAEAEAARLEAQRREQERLRQEQLAEQARQEQQRLEQERRERVAREEAARLEDERRREQDRQEAERLEQERLAEETRRQLEELAEAARRLEAEQAREAESAPIPEDELTRALAEALAADPDADGAFTDPNALDDPDLPRGPRASGVPDDELTHSLDSARSAAPEPIPEDMLTSAIEGALADTLDAPSALTAAASDAPVLTSNELGVLMTHIGECWNISMLSMDAQNTVITVEVRLDRGGVPLPDSVTLVDWQGGSEAAARNAFDVAARAIRSCGEGGLDLPPEKYDRWKRLILDFDPRQMAARAGG